MIRRESGHVSYLPASTRGQMPRDDARLLQAYIESTTDTAQSITFEDVSGVWYVDILS